MKIDPRGAADVTGNVAGVLEREIRTCPVCGTKFTAIGASGACPVCLLRGASWSESDSSEPGDSASTQDTASKREGPPRFAAGLRTMN